MADDEVELTILRRQLSISMDALAEIAAPSDEGAWEYYRATGSFSLFDEPNSVEEALTAMGKVHKVREELEKQNAEA
jgi:hypothetical protein